MKNLTAKTNKHNVSWGSIITFMYHGTPRIGKILESGIYQSHLNDECKIYVDSLISSSHINILYSDIICSGELTNTKYY